jgi:hypothetical protein
VLQSNGQTIPLLENTYDLINNTFGRKAWGTSTFPALAQISIDVRRLNKFVFSTKFTGTSAVAFATTTIDTMSTLVLEWGSLDHNMGGGSDCVIFDVPPAWTLPYGNIVCNFPKGGVICMAYPAAHQLVLYLNSPVTKATLVSGTVAMKTPPYMAIVAADDPPLVMYVYTRSKLVDVYTIPFLQKMQFVSVTVAVSVDKAFVNQIATYTIAITNTKNIPTTGAIEIFYPPELSPREYGCRNDILGGS